MKDTNPEIFKAYDIRGIYQEDLDEESARLIGKAYASLLQSENPDKQLEVVVSRDMRPSSPDLKNGLVAGLTESGVNVIDVGMQTTPTFYFAVSYYERDGGIQITASHNPPEYNGFKLVRSQARPIGSGTGMEELRDRVLNQDFLDADQTGAITAQDEVLAKEVNLTLEQVDVDQIKPFKVVIDAANSVGALDMKALFDKLPCEMVPLYFNLDGTFPNHEADPLKPENLEDLQQKVKDEQADLGIALDGDGDRIFFIDEKGEVVPQPILRGLVAQAALQDHPGATICYDIRPGKITRDMIVKAGGKPVLTKVGHSFIKAKMREVDAVFAGESSGHYYYKFEYGYFDAPMMLVVKFLEYISQLNQPVSEIIKPYDRYYHSGEINSMVDDKDAILKRLAETYSDGEVSDLDGVTVTYDDFWFNVRASNTEPKIRLNLEAVSPEVMEEKRDEVLTIIRGK